MSLVNYQFPPPKDWQAFERFCFFVFRAEWSSTDIQMNGRQGQPQYGVDIFGSRKDSNLLIGLQCKGKDSNFGHTTSIEEISEEVLKAEGFSPPLAEYIFATSAKRDTDLQKQVLHLSKNRVNAGKFPVQVASWDDIELALQAHLDVARVLYPQFFGHEFTSQQIREYDAIKSASLEDAGIDTDTLSRSLDPIFSNQLDEAKKLLHEYKARDALRLLTMLDASSTHIRADYTKFRLYTNLAGAYQGLEDYKTAAQYLRTSAKFDHSDKATSNLALAALFEGRDSDALEICRKRLPKGDVPDSILGIYVTLAPLEEIDSIQFSTRAQKSYPVARALAHRFCERGEFGKARNVLLNVSEEPENIITKNLAKIDVGSMALIEFFFPLRQKRLSEPTVKERLALLGAANDMRAALSNLPQDALFEQRSGGYVNLGVIEGLLGDSSSATHDFNKSLEIKPNVEAHKNVILVLVERNQLQEAKEYFDKHSEFIASNSIHSYLSLLSVFASIPKLLSNKDEEINKLAKQLTPDSLVLFALQYIENSKSEISESVVADTIVPVLEKQWVGIGEWLLFLMRLFKGGQVDIENRPKAADVFDGFLSALPVLLAIIERLLSSRYYLVAYEYAEYLYKNAPLPKTFSLFLESAYRSGNGGAVFELITETDIEKQDRATALSIVDIQINFGDLDNAKSNLNKLKDAGAVGGFAYWSRLANIALREDDQSTLQAVIDALRGTVPNNLLELEQIVQILNTDNKQKESIGLLFRYRLQYSDQLKYHVLYVMTCLLTEENQQVAMEQVVPGIGVKLKFENGEAQLLFVGKSEQLREFAIGETSELCKAILGHKVGDRVSISGPIAQRVAVIEQLLTPEHVAFLDSQRKVQLGGWNETFVAHVDLSEKILLPGGQEVPKNLYEQLKQRADYVESMFALSNSNKITYFLLSEAIGADIYDLIKNLLTAGREFKNALPRASASLSASPTSSFVFTISGIAVLSAIEKLDECVELLKTAGSTLVVPRHVVDFFVMKHKQLLRDLPRKHGTAGVSNNVFFFAEEDSEARNRAVREVEHIVQTMRRYFHVVASPVLPQDENEDGLISVLGLQDIAAATVARHRNGILVLDDTLAGNILSVKGNTRICNVAWLYEWMESAGLIRRDQQVQTSVALLIRGADGFTLSRELLWEAMLEGFFKGDIYFIRALNTLAKFKQLNATVFLGIFGGFLVTLWRSDRNEAFKREYTARSLSLVFGSHIEKPIWQGLASYLAIGLYLEPIVSETLGEELEAFRKQTFVHTEQ